MSLLAEPGTRVRTRTHVNVHAHVIAIPSGVDMADGFTTGYSSANNLREGLAPQPPPQVVIQQQDQVIRQQDQALDQLSASVGMLHRMGNEIHGELITQVAPRSPQAASAVPAHPLPASPLTAFTARAGSVRNVGRAL